MSNKILSILFLGSALFASAQISVSAKANLLFPTNSSTWKNVTTVATEAYETKGKTNIGFNAGLSFKAKLVRGLFIMPEIYYTSFKNNHTDPISNTSFEAKSNRIDVPILLGINMLGDHLGVFVGPVASYNLSRDNQYNDFIEKAATEFTLGYQFGAQIKIENLIFTGRYESAISEDQREFINNNSGQTIRYDSRPSLFLAGVGYQF